MSEAQAMSGVELREALAERGALLDGHFRLSSGRHSDRFVQKFRILEDPQIVERIAAALAQQARPFAPTVVVSAAVGGIVLGYETARQLGAGFKAIFVEKENGVAALRRGFALGPGDRAFVVEDVVTTGGSVREVLEVVRACGAETVAVGAIVRRQPADFGVPSIALLDLPVVSYEPSACPQCARGEAITEPGSRFLAKERAG
jgi:orotate phosphoribosyltransferase